MESIQLKVEQVFDFGPVVSIVGIDLQSNVSVIVHIDHRPFEAMRDALKKAGLANPERFKADRLTLSVLMLPEEIFSPSPAA